MEKILKVHSVNDYARYIGAEELHPLISVIHYDELEHCRHSLNNYVVARASCITLPCRTSPLFSASRPIT